jgi:PKD repeat protein
MKVRLLHGFIFSLLLIFNNKAYSQKWEWLAGGGARYDQRARAVAIDDNGNVYATGYINDSLVIQGNKLKSYGMFLSKFDSKGKLIFSKGYGYGSSTEAMAMTYDKNGYLYITGTYHGGSIKFGSLTLTTPNSNAQRSFLAKLDLNGNGIWAVNVHEGTSSESYKVKYNERDSTVAVGGYFYGAAKLNFGSDTFLGRGSNDVFMAAFNSITGKLKWADVGGTKGYDAFSHMDFDKNNNLYVTFLYQRLSGVDSFKSRQIRIPATTGYDCGLVKYNSNGKVVWAKNASGSGDQYVRGMKFSRDNKLYLTIYSNYNSSINFFGTNYKVSYQYESSLLKIDSNGNILKRKEVFVAGLGATYKIESDSLYLYLLGENSFKAPNVTAIGNGYENFYIIKMDTSLTCLKSITGGKETSFKDLAVSPNGTCVVGGAFDWSKDSIFKVGPFGYKGRGDEELFVAQWNFEDSCVKPKPQISYTKNGKSYTFKDNGKINTDKRNWNFGDGKSDTAKSPIHTYANSGAYKVVLVAENQCGRDTTEIMLYVDCAPKANFGFVVSGKKVTVTDSSSSTSRTWYFGDGQTNTSAQTTNTYSTGGFYTIKLIVQNICGIDSIAKKIVVDCIAKAGFSYSITGKSVQFKDTSRLSIARIWDFGNGKMDTSKNPIHAYANNGNYVVKLKTFGICYHDSITQTVIINCKYPVSNFNFTDTNLSVSFVSTSQSASKYLWKFGNGLTDTSKNTVHNYSIPGSYQVKLVTENICGKDSLTKQVNIFCNKPEIDFTFIITGKTVDFKGRTNSLKVFNWKYDLGDGQTKTGKDISHTYGKSGVYTITLTAENACGLDTFIQKIALSCIPKAAFSYTYSGSKFNFKDSSDNTISRKWYFGDGSTDSTLSPVHTYQSNDKYWVKLVVNSGCGVDSILKEITVDCTPPEMSFTYTIVERTIKLKSQADKPGVTGRVWDFGDGVNDTSANPEHTYALDGIYKVTLTGYNDCRKNEVSTQILIKTGRVIAMTTCDISMNYKYSGKQLEINYFNCNSLQTEVQVWNTNGQCISRTNIHSGTEKTTLDLDKLGNGNYFIRVLGENKVYATKKILIVD